MNKVELLFDNLDHEYNPDYWSDVVRFEIKDVMESLIAEEWDQLDRSWMNLSQQGKINLAEANGMLKHPRAASLLVLMLKAEEADVGTAVASALLERDYAWYPDRSMLPDLNRHLENATPYGKKQIANLISRLVI